MSKVCKLCGLITDNDHNCDNTQNLIEELNRKIRELEGNLKDITQDLKEVNGLFEKRSE